MGTADITLRHLTHQHPEALLQGLCLPAQGEAVEVVGWLDSQRTFVPRERRPDKGLVVRVGGEPRTLIVEIEYTLRGTMGRRIHRIEAMFAPDWPEPNTGPPPPVATLVIVLSGRKTPWPTEHAHRTSWPELGWSGVRYSVDAVYQRTVEELCARGGIFWLVFTPLASNATAHNLREIVRSIRARVPDKEARAELYAAMLTLADIAPWGYNHRQEIEAMLVEEEDDVDMLEVSTFLRNAFEKGKREGLQEGKREGLQEGKREGLQEGKREGLQEGKREGLQEGKREGLQEGKRRGERKAVKSLLHNLFVRYAGRDPNPAEQKALALRAQTGDPGDVQRKALSLRGKSLVQWLTGHDGGLRPPS